MIILIHTLMWVDAVFILNSIYIVYHPLHSRKLIKQNLPSRKLPTYVLWVSVNTCKFIGSSYFGYTCRQDRCVLPTIYPTSKEGNMQSVSPKRLLSKITERGSYSLELIPSPVREDWAGRNTGHVNGWLFASDKIILWAWNVRTLIQCDQ